jgi:hypothetical protein
MKFNSFVFIWVLPLLTLVTIGAPQGWRGIVPLRSTRIDVERLLGSATQMGAISIYKTPNESVYVEYATDRCEGSVPGWNVAAGTVLQLTVTSKSEQLFADLRLDLGRYTKSYDDAMNAYYTNVSEGIKYSVSSNGAVESVSYIPSARDSNLRCRGFPPYTGVIDNQRMFDSYGDLSWEYEKAHLDNFAIALQHNPDSIGYIIVYAGRRACVGEGKDRALRAKRYVVETRGIQKERIKWIDGGYREELTVILQPAPRGAPEPTASPTIKPSEVQLVKNCKPKRPKPKKPGCCG